MTVEAEALTAELPDLVRFANFLTGNAQLADDLVQDCMVRAITAAAQKNETTSVRAWLFAIARNRHIDLIRQTNARPDSEPFDDHSWSLPSADQTDTSDFLRDLSRAFAKLPSDLRETMWLVGIQGFSYAEAAEVMSKPLGTVRSRMFRARELLKDELVDYWVTIANGAETNE